MALDRKRGFVLDVDLERPQFVSQELLNAGPRVSVELRWASEIADGDGVLLLLLEQLSDRLRNMRADFIAKRFRRLEGGDDLRHHRNGESYTHQHSFFSRKGFTGLH